MSVRGVNGELDSTAACRAELSESPASDVFVLGILWETPPSFVNCSVGSLSREAMAAWVLLLGPGPPLTVTHPVRVFCYFWGAD